MVDKLVEIEAYYEELKTINMVRTSGDEEGFLSVEKYDCKLNNGHIIKREKILKNKKDGNAAIVLPITEDNKVILAIEPRVFTKETVDVGYPAGYIEDGELPVVSAVRELEEETGYTSDDLEFLGSFYPDQGCSGAYNYYYLARNCRKVKEQKLDEGEFIKYILVTFAELDELLNRGYIKGLNSAYVIEKSRKYIEVN